MSLFEIVTGGAQRWGLALRGKFSSVCPAHELKIVRITDAQNLFVRPR